MNMHDRPLNKVLLSKDFTDFWMFPVVIFMPAARTKYTIIVTTVTFIRILTEAAAYCKW